MNKIKIVCDSLSDVTDQQIEKYDIEFIPLNIIIWDNEYKDRQDISIDNFYSIIRNDKVIPKTSQATYADFYLKNIHKKDTIFCIYQCLQMLLEHTRVQFLQVKNLKVTT